MSLGGRRFFSSGNIQEKGWNFRQPQRANSTHNLQFLQNSPLNGFQSRFMPQNNNFIGNGGMGFNARNVPRMQLQSSPRIQQQGPPRNFLHASPRNQAQSSPINRPFQSPRNIEFNDSPPTKSNINVNRKRSHGESSTNEDSAYGKRPKGTSTPSQNAESSASSGKYSELTEQANSLVRFQSQSEEMLDKKLRLRSALLCMIRKQFPGISLHLVGSSCNGFASESSDADFCVMISQMRHINQKFEARMYLKAIEKLIQPIRSLKGIQFIRAKVPILKFRDTISGCECDINVNNPVGIRNTHLLRTYSKVDDRVRPMVMAVKNWGKERKINDASQGTLSSYSLVLMILHYLQCGCNPPVLKSLQKEYPQYFLGDSDVDDLPMFEPANMIPCNTSKNTESVGQLLEGFFRYFGEVFMWDTKIMSIREGCTLVKKAYSEFRDKYICIEEPFERTCTSRAVHEQSKFILIKKEFRRANDKLKEKLSLDHIT